jgi:hypothetical protein
MAQLVKVERPTGLNDLDENPQIKRHGGDGGRAVPAQVRVSGRYGGRWLLFGAVAVVLAPGLMPHPSTRDQRTTKERS